MNAFQEHDILLYQPLNSNQGTAATNYAQMPATQIPIETEEIAILADYENLRRHAFPEDWRSRVPNFPAWAEHIASTISQPVMFRFYHGWIDARLQSTSDLNDFNIWQNDPKTKSQVFEVIKKSDPPNTIKFEAARTLWKDSALLPTSRKHTRAECPHDYCPKHALPLQKLVDTMLVADAIKFANAGTKVHVISNDDDIIAAFRAFTRLFVPPGTIRSPGQDACIKNAPGIIIEDGFYYSPPAWIRISNPTARPRIIRR